MVEHKQIQVTLTVNGDMAPVLYRAAASARHSLSKSDMVMTTEGGRLQADAWEMIRLARAIVREIDNA